MSKTFVRFQEFFESPKFRGKVFTLKKFEKWYKKQNKKENKGKFTYYKDFSGHNIPSSVLGRFYAGDFNPLSMRELWFLEQFKNVKGKFYVIGTYKEKKVAGGDTLKHELAHSLFYLNRKYKKEVLEILDKTNLKSLLKKFKKSGEYDKSVYLDECHAYILADLKWMKKTWKVDLEPFKKTHHELKKVFK